MITSDTYSKFDWSYVHCHMYTAYIRLIRLLNIATVNFHIQHSSVLFLSHFSCVAGKEIKKSDRKPHRKKEYLLLYLPFATT